MIAGKQSRKKGRLGRGHVLAALLAICVLIGVFDRVLWAGLASELGSQAKISVSAEEVLLPVRVTDSNGEAVSGLTRDNFRVYEDGALQKVTFFQHADTPVTVGLIVDHSGSMEPKLRQVAAAVYEFAHTSNPQDEMFVVNFSDEVALQPLDGKRFTSDPQVLERAVSAIAADGQTALYDAIIEGLQHLQLGTLDKKALVIISDGGDDASHHKYAEVLNLARQSQAAIFSIGLVGQTMEEENPAVLRRLANDTGGVAFFPRSVDEVLSISKQIAADIREQYTLGYVPERGAHGASFRKIQVKVTAPGRGKLHARTRSGYSISPQDSLSSATGNKAP